MNAARPDAVLVTGDLVDNAQANELALARTVLDGGRARARLGRARLRRGAGGRRPRPRLLPPRRRPAPPSGPARRRPAAVLRAPGCALPGTPCPATTTCSWRASWPARPSTAAVAVGGERLVTPDAGLDVPRSENALTPQLVDRASAAGCPGARRAIAPDPGRRELTPAGGDRRPAGRQRARRQRRRAWTTPSTRARAVRVDRARHRAPRRRLRRRARARADRAGSAPSSPPRARAASSSSPTSR